MKKLGDLINEKRLERGLKMTELAKEVEVSTMYISDIINHKRTPVKDDILQRFSSLLNIPVQILKEAAFFSKAANSISQDNPKEEYQAKLALARSIISSNLTPEKIKAIEKIVN